MKIYASEAIINKGNPNLQAELTRLEGVLGKKGLMLFRALCRDADTPISVEAYGLFRKGGGEIYKYAAAIRSSYEYVDVFLKERGL